MPKITCYGAAQEVTGSCHLLETENARVLLECGLFQGRREDRDRNADGFDFAPDTVDAVVLSHGHLDHSGRLPVLVREGFRGPIYCTPQTRDLLRIMLRDAASLSERDAEWENKRRRRAGKPLIEPMYTQEDVFTTLEQCQALPLEQDRQIADGVALRFREAGHILGSAHVELTLHEGGKERRLVFSGDIGNPNTLLMREPACPRPADWVMMESTYGDRDHKPIESTREELAQILAEAQQDGGNVLIPAFAVGRTQEVLFHLAMLHREGRLPQPFVYLDSPMAIEVSALYLANLHMLDEDDLKKLTVQGREAMMDALNFVRPTRLTEDSMALNRIHGGAIIVAGSGMCEGGRIRHHLKYNLWRRECHVVIVGFQAQGTLGRRLVDGETHLQIVGSDVAVRAHIHTLGAYSAHAGKSQLLDWADAIEGQSAARPKFFLVHGEEDAQAEFKTALKARTGAEVSIPQAGKTLVLD